MTAPLSEVKRTEYPEDIRLMFNCFFCIIVICGITGNSIFCYLFASKRVKCNFFTLLLLNLSVADIISCISILPYAIVDLSWLTPLSQRNANAACTVIMGQMPFWVTTVVTLFTLVFISFSRFVAIAHPLKSRQPEWQWLKKSKTSVRFMLITWPLATCILLPNCFSFHYDRNSAICFRKWPKNVNGRMYGLITAFLGFALPMITLIFTFVSIKRSLSRRLSGSKQTRNNRKTVKLLGTLILAFFICWAPFFIYWILSTTAGHLTFADGVKGQRQRMRIIRGVVLVALCNTILDPIIYVFWCSDINKAFWSCLERKKKICERTELNDSQALRCKQRGMFKKKQTLLISSSISRDNQSSC